MTAAQASRPFERRHRVHHCYRCDKETQQSWLYSSNGKHPEIDHWTCLRCGVEFYAMGEPRRGGVGDGEGLCRFVLNERLRAVGRSDDIARIDRDDALGHLRLSLLDAWIRFDPARGLTFTSYATWKLRNRLTEWMRRNNEKDYPCPACSGKAAGVCSTCGGTGKAVTLRNVLTAAVSLDEQFSENDRDSVGQALGRLVDDGHDDSLAALRGALLRRDRESAHRAGRAESQ